MKFTNHIRASLRVTNLHEVALSAGVSYKELYWFVRNDGEISDDMLKALNVYLADKLINKVENDA